VASETLPPSTEHLVHLYEEFEKTVDLKDAQPQLGDLVRFNGNKDRPIHRWYTFKEGFSAELLPWACRTAGIDWDGVANMLDPFCGVGTSLLSAQLACQGERVLHAYGIEHNPFIRFVARAKLSWPEYRPQRIKDLITKLTSPSGSTEAAEHEVPELSTIHNPKVFDTATVQELLALRDRIRDELTNQPEEGFFLLGWAAAIEQASGVRKDGRALRFVERRNTPPVKDLVRGNWESMLSDLTALKQKGGSPSNVVCLIVAGDGRNLSVSDSQTESGKQMIPELEEKAFDLILYSPPYLNNIDYSEVYKLELWLAGHIGTAEQFRALRLGSLRSHPSIKFPDTSLLDELPGNLWARRLRDSLLQSLPDNNDRLWRARLIRGYVDDMYEALSAQLKVARPGGAVVCVVGNSLHGRKDHPIPVATDLLISALAQAVGFDVERVQVARQLRRRDHNNRLLRESVIFMRCP